MWISHKYTYILSLLSLHPPCYLKLLKIMAQIKLLYAILIQIVTWTQYCFVSICFVWHLLYACITFLSTFHSNSLTPHESHLRNRWWINLFYKKCNRRVLSGTSPVFWHHICRFMDISKVLQILGFKACTIGKRYRRVDPKREIKLNDTKLLRAWGYSLFIQTCLFNATEFLEEASMSSF